MAVLGLDRSGAGSFLPEALPPSRWMRIRAALGTACLVLAFALLSVRLAQLQLVEHERYAALAAQQQVVGRAIGARRGDVRDSAGHLLATSVRSWSVYADPQGVSNPEATAVKLAAVLGLDRRQVYSKLGRPGRFVWVKRQAGDDEVGFLRRLGLEGVHFRPDWKRSHPHGSVAAQVVGLTDVDDQGLSGVELSLEQLLGPKTGWEFVACDAGRRVIRGAGDSPVTAPRDGYDVTLTIDAFVQNVAQEELAKAVQKHAPEAAWAVVLDTRTCAVLAMANWPEFDPEDRTDISGSRNRIITDSFEFGSVMKPFTVAAALEAGAVTPATTIFCHRGAWKVGRRTVHDAHEYDTLTVSDIVVRSSNIGAAQIGMRCGVESLHHRLRLFGLGEPTGVDLPGEAGGILRPASRWTTYSVVSVSFGQEMATTPLSVARAYCTFANGGMLYTPQLVQKVTDSTTGEVLYELNGPAEGRCVVSAETAAQIMEMLRGVVDSGTGKGARLEEYPVAGKTGTAELARPDGRGYLAGKYLSSFAGIAPADEPAVCVLVSMKAPSKNGYYGGTVAAPACARIIERTLRYMGVPPRAPERRVAAQDT